MDPEERAAARRRMRSAETVFGNAPMLRSSASGAVQREQRAGGPGPGGTPGRMVQAWHLDLAEAAPRGSAKLRRLRSTAASLEVHVKALSE